MGRGEGGEEGWDRGGWVGREVRGREQGWDRGEREREWEGGGMR